MQNESQVRADLAAGGVTESDQDDNIAEADRCTLAITNSECPVPDCEGALSGDPKQCSVCDQVVTP